MSEDSVILVRDEAGMAALRDGWLRLEALQDDSEATFFQSHAWIAHVARVRAESEAGFTIMIGVGLQAGRVCFIWPLAVVRRAGIRLAVMLDDPFGQFAGAIAEPGCDVAGFARRVIAALRGHADGLRIAQLPEGSPLQHALAAAGARMSGTQETVVVDLTAYPSYKAFNNATSAKVRKILRNARNRLERNHAIEAVSGAEEKMVSETLRHAFAERIAWMKRSGRYTTAFTTPVFRAVLERASSAGVPCLAFRLQAGEQVASSHFGFAYRGKYYAYLSALNPDFADFSAGRLHLGMVIEDCFARGLHGLELMPPAGRYKLEWNGAARRLDTMSLAFTLRGTMLFTMLDRVLPLARRLSRALPGFIRTPLINLLNRS